MRRLFPIITWCLLVELTAGAQSIPTTTIGYFLASGTRSAEDSSAIAWLRAKGFRSVEIPLPSPAPLPRADAYWVHVPDSSTLLQWENRNGALETLRQAWASGARILFTDLAALFPHRIGIESEAPDVVIRTIRSDGVFDETGYQSLLGNPVFDERGTGTFILDVARDLAVPVVGYFGARHPASGCAIGVEKSYVFVHSDRKILIAYGRPALQGLAAGGFVTVSEPNNAAAHMDRFLADLLGALTRTPSTACDAYSSCWLPADTIAREDARLLAWNDATAPVLAEEEQGFPCGGDGLRFFRDSASGNFFDVSSRETLVMGRESGGIDEIWHHPIRSIRDLHTSLVVNGAVRRLEDFPCRFEARPASCSRSYRLPGGTLEETIEAVSTSAIVRYRYSGGDSIALLVRFRSDFRLMWPYDANALGALHYACDDSTAALRIVNCPALPHEVACAPRSRFELTVMSNRRALTSTCGVFEQCTFENGTLATVPARGNTVTHAAVYGLAPAAGADLTLTFSSARLPRRDSLSVETGAGPSATAVDAPPVRTHGFPHHPAALTSGSREFDTLYAWAQCATDRFWTHTVGIGTALTAGFATTARGWDGGQVISGRPGYAWYFGRDAAWSCFAIDGYGDTDDVREELRFLARYQDLNGKILHEMSTSGVVHYDAADATPLFVMLAAHFLRASRDTACIVPLWPSIDRAMRYLYTTDTDGDGVIDNTDAGHGWVEGGALAGAHTEFYLAGLWARTLRDVTTLAAAVRPHLRAQEQRSLDSTAARARATLQRPKVRGLFSFFWNDSTRFFQHALNADGTFNHEPTILAAVPILLLADDTLFTAHAPDLEPPVRRYASTGFTADWGTRIISEESPHFDPRGYHSGSVWPLFTGWTALAEYAVGRSVQAYAHVMQTARIARHWSLGSIQEVMNGATYEPAGVCHRQCWSETAVLHPVIEGMIGWKPDAYNSDDGIPISLLRPRFPVEWDSARAPLSVGRSLLLLEMHRSATETEYVIHHRDGGPVDIDFAPEVPSGTEILGIVVNGTAHRGHRGPAGLLEPALRIHGSATISITRSGGAGMAAEIPDPAPGDSSLGYRIIEDVHRIVSGSSSLFGVTLEGRSGTTHDFTLRTFDRPVADMSGANAIARGAGFYTLRVAFPASAARYTTARVLFSLAGSGQD